MVKALRDFLFKKTLQAGPVLGLVAFFAASQAQALEYRIVSPMVSYRQAAVQNLLNQAKSLLPDSIKSTVGTVEVSFGPINDPHGEALGVANYRKSRITLREDLMVEALKGPDHSTPTLRHHKNMYRETLATVLHETVHLYDFANVHTDEENQWIDRCDTTFAQDKDERIRNGSRPYACKFYENMHTSFSKNPYFLQVAGWMGQSENGFTQRSPDIYEVTDSKEYLAVNMEYFLLDSDYKCRRPAMYKVLSSQFHHIPYANVNCDQQLGYVIPNSSYKMAQLLNIDPARVYQVHYLFADKGSDLVSGWGHAMIRLVVCSPQRQTVGPDCLRDVESHVVLSFRAFVDSMSTSMWAGFSGKYPSRLFILPMSQVIDEYPRGQFRALKSLPLRLSRQQIQDLITRSVEIHWGYEGKYKFVTNNCATETLNLLQSVLLTPEIMFSEIKTPISLYKTLVRLGLGDDSVMRDLNKAKELGFYFDSYEERFQKTFKIVTDNMSVPAKDFKEYLNLPAYVRYQVIQAVNKSQPNSKKVAASLFVLEMAAQRQLQNSILMDLQKIVMQQMDEKGSQRGGQAGEIMNNYLALATLFAKPSAFLLRGGGYGLPEKAELADAAKLIDEKAKKAAQTSEATKKMTDSLTTQAMLAEVEQVNTNIKSLQKLLRDN